MNMKKIFIILAIILCIALAIIAAAGKILTVRPAPTSTSPDFLRMPEHFHAEVFADGLEGSSLSTPGPNPGPRMMEFRNDTVLVSVPSAGAVYALEDLDRDARLDAKKIFLDGLNNPHGIAFNDEWIYIAEESRVIRVKDTDNDNIAERDTLEHLVSLPEGGHFTRTIRIFDDRLYISIGSSCNVCNEEDLRRATIQTCDLSGKDCRTFAKGLRNTVGFTRHQGKIYGTDNGRDWLGQRLPPDEINIIEEGGNYGWPTCYGKNIHDTDYDTNTYIRNPCMEPFEKKSFIDLPAHVAPLGLSMYSGTTFPDTYRNTLFVALHGSWNAETPVGYKIVTVDINSHEVADFATGFMGDGVVYGRPVDILNFREGLLVTDDNKGRIYRIYYDK